MVRLKVAVRNRANKNFHFLSSPSCVSQRGHGYLAASTAVSPPGDTAGTFRSKPGPSRVSQRGHGDPSRAVSPEGDTATWQRQPQCPLRETLRGPSGPNPVRAVSPKGDTATPAEPCLPKGTRRLPNTKLKFTQ